jgi:uncharacterized protein YjbI with pentapeptide repeats
VSSELLAIGITVLVIDNANERLAMKQEKERLMLQLGSPSNEFAIEALRQLRWRGYHADGSLRNSKLIGAKLAGADLTKADLSHAVLGLADLTGADLCDSNLSHAILVEADLTEAYLINADLTGAGLVQAQLSGAILQGVNAFRANLSGADLERVNLGLADMSEANLHRANLKHATQRWIDLSGADLSEANLEGFEELLDCYLAEAGQMRGGIMPDGEVYDGRFNLDGDLADALRQGISTNDPKAMAEFYGVDQDAFERGQTWAAENLEILLAQDKDEVYSDHFGRDLRIKVKF